MRQIGPYTTQSQQSYSCPCGFEGAQSRAAVTRVREYDRVQVHPGWSRADVPALFAGKKLEFLAPGVESIDGQWVTWIDVDPHSRTESDDLGKVVLRRRLNPHEPSWPGRLDGLLVARLGGAAHDYVCVGVFCGIPDIADETPTLSTISPM